MHPAPGSDVGWVTIVLIPIISAVNLKELLRRMLRSYGPCLPHFASMHHICSHNWIADALSLLHSHVCHSHQLALEAAINHDEPPTYMVDSLGLLNYYQALGVLFHSGEHIELVLHQCCAHYETVPFAASPLTQQYCLLLYNPNVINH